MDTDNYRKRVMHKLAEALELPKLTFQVVRRSIAALAQKKGTVKDVQGVMRHSRTATTTDVYMQEIPESVQATINSIKKELRQRRPKERRRVISASASKKLVVGASQPVRGAISNEGIPVLTPNDTKPEEREAVSC